MVPFIVPLFLPMPHGNFGMERIPELEKSLLVSFGIIRLLLEKLHEHLGPDALGPELIAMASSSNRADAEKNDDEIDALIVQGREPAATRYCREIMGVTWDQALDAIGHWQSYPREDKIRLMQSRAWTMIVNKMFSKAEKMLENRTPMNSI